MRILMAGPFPYRTIPSRFEGMYFLDSLIQLLIDRGNEVVILTSDSNIESDIDLQLGRVSLHVSKIGKHGNIRAAHGFKTEIRAMRDYIVKLDRTSRFEVMHAHWSYEYAMSCVEVDPERTIVTLHDWPDVVCPMFHSFYWKQRQKLGNKVIHKAKSFTAVSPYIAHLLQSFQEDKRVQVIPNSISTEKLYLRSDEARNDIIVLAVNNGFSERKNVTSTIQAFRKAKEHHEELKLVLCGDDYEPNGTAEKWCVGNDISTDDISFMGKLDANSLTEQYRRASVFVHASKEESFGLILIEAMKNGCPIIAGKNSGAVPWVLEDGKSGKLVDVNSVEELTRALEDMIEPRNRKIYREQGYRRVHDFDEKNILPLYLKYYVEVAGDEK